MATTFVRQLRQDPDNTESIGVEVYTSKVLDIDTIREQFAIQIRTENGSTPNATVTIEFSVDGVGYVDVQSDTINTTDGNVVFDFPSGSGVSFVRIKIDNTAGSLEIANIIAKGKQ